MKLDHIVLLVSDLAVSLAYYETLLPLLGFRKTGDNVFGNDEEIYLDIRLADKPDHQYERFAPGLNHIGFTAPDREAITEVQNVMKTAGYDAPEVQMFGDDVALFMKDPDGMRIEIAVYGGGQNRL